ncbi:hypothetical protein VaNZ11_014752 [Volvox africanus]|uniref:Peptidase M20 dimerisation domain-containing protein n=1 Tax=Volvox africanus TaxID=51714 RepID=A0ABQ5SKK9_9CHLO|nr:hypothetical protein VaNZ11_014752 [Volvox africanus]
METLISSAVLRLWVLCACCAITAYCQSYTTYLEEAKGADLVASLLRWRRELHKMPELGFLETSTSEYIRTQLDQMGIPYEYPVGKTGIRAGPLGKTDEGVPTIALRADMDGLPITEEVDVPYKSMTPGRMHACGHDAHMAMLLGAARLLKSNEASLPGGVVLLFQPAEEGLGGARMMIEEGALRGVGAIHGLHVWPALPAGVIGTRPGVLLAASDRFSFVVRGVGGHGAMPHTTRDPVVAAAAVVMALQVLVARETSPMDSAVVTVSTFNTGPGATNVIPESVKLSGTVRALANDTFHRLRIRVGQVATGIAAGYGCVVDNVTWSEVPYPPTRNDERLSALVREVATNLLESPPESGDTDKSLTRGSAKVQEVGTAMTAEDFSFYGDVVPQTAFTVLGIGDSAKGTNVGLHNPRFQMNDEQLPLGAALHAALATAWLEQQAQRQQEQESGGTAATTADVHEETDDDLNDASQPDADSDGVAMSVATAADSGEDPRIESLRKYAREKGVKRMPPWLRKVLARESEFAHAVAQADFEDGLRERLEQARLRREEQQRKHAAAAADAAGTADAPAVEGSPSSHDEL